jgi:hypothetical protein
MIKKGKPIVIIITGEWYKLQEWPTFTLAGNAPFHQQCTDFLEIPPEFCHEIDEQTPPSPVTTDENED